MKHFKKITTKKELLEYLENDLKDIPDDITVVLDVRAGFCADLEFANVQTLWKGHKQHDCIVLSPSVNLECI